MGDEWKTGHVAGVATIMLLVGIVLMLAIDGITGRIYLISSPITDLESGQLYEVMGVARVGEDCYLLLRAKADERVRFYQLLSNEVPVDLEAGDGLVKLSTGLTRLPDEFA